MVRNKGIHRIQTQKKINDSTLARYLKKLVKHSIIRKKKKDEKYNTNSKMTS